MTDACGTRCRICNRLIPTNAGPICEECQEALRREGFVREDGFPQIDRPDECKTALWMEVEVDLWGGIGYQCSNCGDVWNLECGAPDENNMNYCPNCGAKMFYIKEQQ